jgi:hypothetical protein
LDALEEMKLVSLALLAGLAAGCTNAYWTRPGASLPELASESHGCYQASVGFDAPSALPGPSGGPRLLPRSTPPPKLWKRAPEQAAFERLDEQLHYQRCMAARGWTPARAAAPTL